MSQSLTSKKIAKRYVTSLFTGFTKDKESADAAKNIAEIGAMLTSSEDLRAFIASPLHTKDTQAAVMQDLAEKAKFTKPVADFLQVLVHNRRLNILPAIVTEAEAYLEKMAGTVSVNIATARKLAAADQKKIQTEIKAALGKDVVMQTFVDESLIGGLVVQVGSTLIDGSIKTKLDRLERQLVGKNAA